MGAGRSDAKASGQRKSRRRSSRWYARFLLGVYKPIGSVVDPEKCNRLFAEMCQAVELVLRESRRYPQLQVLNSGNSFHIYNGTQSQMLIRLRAGRSYRRKEYLVWGHTSQPVRGGVLELLQRDRRTVDYFRFPVWVLGTPE